MSVSTDISWQEFECDAGTVSYALDFPFFSESDLVVLKKNKSTGEVTKLILNADYTVGGASDGVRTVIPSPLISSSYHLIAYREIAATQPLQYEEADEFPAASHEQGLDRLTFLAQQNSRKLGASFRLRESDGELNRFAKVTNALVGIDATGVARMFTGEQILSLLNLLKVEQDYDATKTFLTAAERASAIPDFPGQVGVQLDTATVYIGTGTNNGDWAPYSFTLGTNSVGTTQVQDGSITVQKLAFPLDLSGKSVTLPSGSVTAAMLSSTLDLSAKSVTLPAASVLPNLPSGTVLKTAYAETTVYQNITTTFTKGNTAPTSGTGTALLDSIGNTLTAKITPSSASNKINIAITVPFAGAAGYSCLFIICRGTTVVASFLDINISASYPTTASFHVQDSPASTAEQAYSVRCCCESTGMRINGNNLNRLLGGTQRATISLQEIKA